MIFTGLPGTNLPVPQRHNPFQSFWMGGYECSDKLNAHGNRVDLLTATGHLHLLEEDYRRIQDFGIRTVREGIRWSFVEKQPYTYDWSTVERLIRTGMQCGIQQVWDLCHFGYPDDLSPLHPHFTRRFVALCREFVRFYRSVDPDRELIVTPINEVSFLSWLGGDVAGTAPYAIRMGWEVKYHLMRAYIQGVSAMKEADPSVRILTTEPLVQIVPPLEATEQEVVDAAIQHELQYQATDMLCGRICPELGGTPEHMDMLGVNFYFNNQWELGYRQLLPWANEGNDPRWRPFSALAQEAYNRYQQPIVLTETSHPGEHRPEWISYIARECTLLLQQDVPFWGVCLYPIIDRPDWDNLSHWHSSGLWDAELLEDLPPGRLLNLPYADALRQAQLAVSAVQQHDQWHVF
ncbi:amine oxidase [Paraflavisolibacter sp. H34]|uniref:amine oxidase n=1 Tax=Huijunlia imazamoxiresistens TaxID=3127457 RepID=UPI003015DB1E